MTWTLEELAADEVIVAVPDLQGRLQGSRLSVSHFAGEVARRGMRACTYLLAADVDMRTDAGYAWSPWDDGFGDFLLVPDLATLRPLPWDPGTALVIADASWLDGTPVALAPRQVLAAQLSRLDERGLCALAGTELELLAFRESYQEAQDRGYTGLRPATRHNVDYSLTGLDGMDRLTRRIRREMAAAGLLMESARGECHPGQYEIVFRYADALAACDSHVFYKTGVKAIAAQEGMAVTFMPRYDDGDGNSCHVHLSLRSLDGAAVFADAGRPIGMSTLMEQFVAGQLACLPELTLLFAPTVNAYKRLRPGGFAPTVASWGPDDRTAAVRVLGDGPALRLEHRVGGGDANPYLAVAAIVAAGLHGIEHALPLPPSRAALAAGGGSVVGAVDSAKADAAAPRAPAAELAAAGAATVGFAPAGGPLPRTLRDAATLFARSEVARKAFGDAVVDHYTHAALVEADAFDDAVTDWERHRGFERL